MPYYGKSLPVTCYLVQPFYRRSAGADRQSKMRLDGEPEEQKIAGSFFLATHRQTAVS
jgi:hypothetical protein